MDKQHWYTQGFDAGMEARNIRISYICEQIRQTVDHSCDGVTADVIRNWLLKLEGKQCRQSKQQR